MFKVLDSRLYLEDYNDPFSAKSTRTNKPVIKFSYLNGKVLFSYPGEFHKDAIDKANDSSNFDNYVRLIYDPYTNTIGSRALLQKRHDEHYSWNKQYDAYQFFKKFNPTLQWKPNIIKEHLKADVEELDMVKINESGIFNKESYDMLIKIRKITG